MSPKYITQSSLVRSLLSYIIWRLKSPRLNTKKYVQYVNLHIHTYIHITKRCQENTYIRVTHFWEIRWVLLPSSFLPSSVQTPYLHIPTYIRIRKWHPFFSLGDRRYTSSLSENTIATYKYVKTHNFMFFFLTEIWAQQSNMAGWLSSKLKEAEQFLQQVNVCLY